MTDLKIQYMAVKARLAKARQDFERVDEVQLLAVSKTHSIEKIAALADLGQKKFGESYLQEALPKIASLPNLEWHFIGPIQSNKAKAIAENFDWVQSVDRLKIAEMLNEHRPVGRGALNVLLQVNVSQEATKSGFSLDEVVEAAEAIQDMENLKLRGVMCIPAPSDTFAEQARAFSPVRKIYETLKEHYASLDTLSMGMSADLEAAVAQGSNCVRVGTDIFGSREN